MNSKWRVPGLVATLLLALSGICFGDIYVVKEVVIAPKGVHAAANIGSVNSSVNVRLDSATVDIHVDKPGRGPLSLLPLKVKAVFQLINESGDSLQLTVGFPVSNSQYSSFELSYFRVVTDGAIRDVFRRKSSYPRQLIHEYVSGGKGPGKVAPPADVNQKNIKLFGEQFMGRETFQNLMVWEETFSPAQQKKVEVYYEIEIPLQENKVVRKKEKGNHKGVWPQEANNVPVEFLHELDSGPYYFFDYYLTSGASWAGPITFEDVIVRFDHWWQDLEFHSTIKQGRISWSNRTLYPELPIIAYYTLRNVEPTENIYFAIRPGKNNKRKPAPSGDTVIRPVK